MYYYIHSYYSTEICITINKKYFYNIGIITYWYESIPGCWTGFFRNEHAIRIKHLHIPQILNHETGWPCGSILGSSWPTLWSDQHWLNNSSKYALHNATLLLPSCYVSFSLFTLLKTYVVVLFGSLPWKTSKMKSTEWSRNMNKRTVLIRNII